MLGELPREIAERVLGGAPEESASSDRIVRAFAAACERLDRTMSSILGELGYRAMLTRCLRSVKAAHPCLDGVLLGEGEVFHQPIVTCFEGEEAPVVFAASSALFSQFITLLEALIGSQLTTTLFRRAWPEAFVTVAEDEGT